jgi:hypothetical protein
MRLFKVVEPKEGVDVQFVGVYVLRWNPEWGEPTVGFIEVDESELNQETKDVTKNSE